MLSDVKYDDPFDAQYPTAAVKCRALRWPWTVVKSLTIPVRSVGLSAVKSSGLAAAFNGHLRGLIRAITPSSSASVPLCPREMQYRVRPPETKASHVSRGEEKTAPPCASYAKSTRHASIAPIRSLPVPPLHVSLFITSAVYGKKYRHFAGGFKGVYFIRVFSFLVGVCCRGVEGNLKRIF